MDETPQDDLNLPDDVVDALVSTAREADLMETWVPKRQGIILRVVPRALRLLSVAISSLPESVMERKTIRQNTLHILSYARADIRLKTLFDMGINTPEILHDLLSGDIDPEYVPHRYNIITSLGIFARHGLINGITSPERVIRADRAMRRSKQFHKADMKEEAQS